jgi:hypothetical protein
VETNTRLCARHWLDEKSLSSRTITWRKHIGESSKMATKPIQPGTSPTLRSVVPANSNVTGAIRKGQRSNSGNTAVLFLSEYNPWRVYSSGGSTGLSWRWSVICMCRMSQYRHLISVGVCFTLDIYYSYVDLGIHYIATCCPSVTHLNHRQCRQVLLFFRDRPASPRVI